jgi:orotidine-5'-phosphate decarboxylase
MDFELKKNKLIFALDVNEEKTALDLVEKTHKYVGCYKIGMELFFKYGSHIVKKISRYDTPIFLDLKLHDIPVTVARAISSLNGLPVKFLTIHTGGGLKMMEEALKSASNLDYKPELLGVTLLTSLNSKDLVMTGCNSSPEKIVIARVKTALNAGLHGVVASGKEIKIIRKMVPDNFKLVIPGIRPSNFSSGDQKRVITPKDAINDGADYIVVGRPIRDAVNPEEAALNILKEI